MAENVLELDDIQGNAVPGFNKPAQALLFLVVDDVDDAKAWLQGAVGQLTSARHVLDFRAVRRLALRSLGLAVPFVVKAWMNVGFTSAGLRKIGVDTNAFLDPAFRAGMAARAELIGDTADSAASWLIGAPDKIPDLIVILGHDTAPGIAAAVDEVLASLPSSMRVLHQDQGLRLPAPYEAWEHFGFRDGISQPGLRGMISDRPGDYLTPRLNPDNSDQGLPGQYLVWPGEFVFGYPSQSVRPGEAPGPVSTAGPSWSRNGSYLAYRRLVQDVAGFHDFLAQATQRLRAQFAELANLSVETLGARLLGRWPSGAPLSRSPMKDDPAMGADDLVSNNFLFKEATPELDIGGQQYPAIPGDPASLRCPFAAHIRKADPRDGGSEGAIRHRILRRGINFGPPYPDPAEKGMLFLCYQASIERQFEFIISQWLIQTNEPVAGAGLDALLGEPGRIVVVTLPTVDGDLRTVALPIARQFVTPTGGEYFFVPSISAVRMLTA